MSDTGLTFYRCVVCTSVVSEWDIMAADKRPPCKCGHGRIRPTNLTFMEKVKQIAKHPAVWKWSRVAT